MKNIGTTPDGNHIVEMNFLEYRNFTLLCMAVEKKELPNFMHPNEQEFRTDFDFSKTFEVIKAYFLAQFKVTELQVLLDEIRKSISE